MGKGGNRTCVICGIKEKHKGDDCHLLFSTFPLNEDRCREWLRAVGNEELVYIPIEKLHHSRHVCGKHFRKQDFNKKGNRLKCHAVPTINLTAVPLSDSQLTEFPQYMKKSKIESMEELPSTSHENVPPAHSQSHNEQTSVKSVAEAISRNVEKGVKRKLDEVVEATEELPSTSHQKENVLPAHSQSHNEPTSAKSVAETVSKNKGEGLKRKLDKVVESTEELPSTSHENVPPAHSQSHKDIIDRSALSEISLNEQTSAKSVAEAICRNEGKGVKRKLDEVVEATEELPSTSHQKENVPPAHSQSHNEPTSAKSVAKTISKNEGKGVNRKLDEIIDLTPRKRKLMERLRKTKCNLASLKKSALLIEKIESSVLKEIVTSTIKNQKRKPKGRRWTTKNKISALAIYKRSPKTYRYLQHLMPLPSTKTLLKVLKKIEMEPGIQKTVLEHLKKISKKRSMQDKICCLVFDEMALKKRLIYDIETDKVEGYQDFGMTGSEPGRSPLLADHALVFLLQGVRAKFKQPVAFYLVKGTVSSAKLASIIKSIVHAVHETDFKIIATVCDQGPTNMGALKILRESSPDTDSNFFKIENNKVFIIYDVPHLFKSIRNNFYNYGELEMDGKKAKWSHLIKIEQLNRNLLYLSKITPTHVQPKYRAKMKVKYAAQILSNTVAAVLKLAAQSEKDEALAEEINQTGIIIHDLDRLFDCTNGPSCPNDIKKGRRENVSQKTDHVQLWTEFRKKLETVKFKKSNGVVAKNVRCIQGYKTTLCSLRDIWHDLNSLGFKYLNLRQLNQDSLENLFGIIRQHSPTNKNPTCSNFIGALKTAIVSGMTAPHNRGSNCEKDFNKLLTDFHNLIFEGDKDQDKKNENELVFDIIDQQEQEYPVLSIPDTDYESSQTERDLTEMEQQPLVYVCGYLASTIVKHHTCPTCKDCLTTEQCDNPTYAYIKLREWWDDKPSLTYPAISLCRLIETAISVFEDEVLPCHYLTNLSKYAVTLFMAKCDSTFLKCNKHKDKVLNYLFTRLAILLVRRQCQRQNQLVALEEETSADACKKAQQRGVAK